MLCKAVRWLFDQSESATIHCLLGRCLACSNGSKFSLHDASLHMGVCWFHTPSVEQREPASAVGVDLRNLDI